MAATFMHYTGDKQKPVTNVLYHVKSHGVTRELTDNWHVAFSYSEELRRKQGSEVVQLLTIRDARTHEQKFPAER